jgi:hypothetical protein
MNKLVSGAIGVEVQLYPNISKVNFPDVAVLRKKRIKHIDVFWGIKTPSGNDIAANSSFFITLTEANTQKELISDLALSVLNVNGERLFINKIIDLQRSFITLSSITDPANVTNKSLYFVFWYDEPSVWGEILANGRTSIQPIELTLTGLKTHFLENRDLVNKRFQNLILCKPVITPSGKAGLTNNLYLSTKFLTLQRNGLQFISQVPLSIFYQSLDNYPIRLQNIRFDFQNSFIETINTSANDLKTVFFNAVIDDSINIKR